MLKPTQMTKITVIGTQRHLKQVIGELYALNVLHIEDHVKDKDLDIGTPLPDSSALSELLVRLNAVLALFKLQPASVPINLDKPTVAVMDEARGRIAEVTALEEERSKGEQRMLRIKESLEKLKLLSKAGVDPGDFTSLQKVKLFVGLVKDKTIRIDLQRIDGASFDIQPHGDKLLVSVVARADAQESVLSAFTKHAVNQITDDALDAAMGTAEQIVKDEQELKAQQARLIAIDKQLAALKRQHGDFFLEARERLLIENEKAEAPLRFGATEKTFTITGFVPSDNLLKVHRRLTKVTDDTVILYINRIEDKESVPIEMHHPKLVKPFEFFMHLYTLPSYREIDPTFFTFLTFPFFFGFMLGDMGYGLVNLVLFLWLKKKFPAAKDFFRILVWASILTIIAGAFFGEFFGFEELGHFEIPHVLSRSHQQMDLLYLSLALGAFHIIFALLLGFVNEYRHHGFKHAFLHKISWLVLLAGVGLFLLGRNLFGGIVLGIAVIMLLVGEGPMGLIELPGIFGNILSYARLMAIGLASVSLALIIDEFAVEFAHQGGAMFIAAALIMVIGHTINLVLGLIGPFLHSLRLHYVEFFSKFYTGGGRLFRPFGYGRESEQERAG